MINGICKLKEIVENIFVFIDMCIVKDSTNHSKIVLKVFANTRPNILNNLF
jgi:hypothetical protein